jgi:hypothetical protein
MKSLSPEKGGTKESNYAKEALVKHKSLSSPSFRIKTRNFS